MKTSGGQELVDTTSGDTKVLAKLYEAYRLLKQDPLKNEKAYKAILGSTKKSTKVKKLASQFIPIFVKHFPSLYSKSVDALIDLAEDDDSAIRMAAISGFPAVCEEKKDYCNQIADVLGQLLFEADNKKETRVVENSLKKVLSLDITAGMIAIREHIVKGFADETDEKERDIKRETSDKVIEFLKVHVVNDLKFFTEWNQEMEETMRDMIVPLLGKCDHKQFVNFLVILQNLKIFRDDPKEGPLTLHNLALEKSGCLDFKFDPKDEDSLDSMDKLFTLIRFAVTRLLSKKVFEGLSPEKYLTVLMEILPSLDKLTDKRALRSLMILAELCKVIPDNFCGDVVANLYKELEKQLPLPSGDAKPEVVFSYVEPLLFSFMLVAEKVPGQLGPVCGIKIYTGQPSDLLNTDDYTQKKKDFVNRLKYTVQKAIDFKKLNPSVFKTGWSKKPDTLSEEEEKKWLEENRRKDEAKRTIDNIINVGNGLLKDPPHFVRASFSWVRRPKKKAKKKRKGKKDIKRKTTAPQQQGEPKNKRRRKNTGPKKPNLDFQVVIKNDARPNFNRGRGGFRGRGRGRRGGFRGRGRGARGWRRNRW